MVGLTSWLIVSGRQMFLKDEPFEKEAGVTISSTGNFVSGNKDIACESSTVSISTDSVSCKLHQSN
jgi:hypothetical protein